MQGLWHRHARPADQPLFPSAFLLLFFRHLLREIRDLGHRAGQFTGAATGAFTDVDITGVTADSGSEITGLAGEGGHFAPGQEFDIEMAANLHQLWRDDAHRTVVGREGLVQLGHLAADGRRSFHQVDLEAGVGKVKGRLHAADAAADNHHRPRQGWGDAGLQPVLFVHRGPSPADVAWLKKRLRTAGSTRWTFCWAAGY